MSQPAVVHYHCIEPVAPVIVWNLPDLLPTDGKAMTIDGEAALTLPEKTNSMLRVSQNECFIAQNDEKG